MAMSTSLRIKGHVITFMYGDGHLDGVLLRPEDWKTDDPTFYEAIKIATELYQEGYDYYLVVDSYTLADPYNAPDETLVALLTKANRLLEHCRWPIGDTGQKYLTRAKIILEDEISRREQGRRRPKQQKKEKYTHPGYVYLLQSPTSAYKIGRTQDPDNRLATFGVTLPFEVEYIALIKTPDMYGLERKLHAHFKSKRRGNTEWFDLSSDDVAYIKSLAVQS